MINGYRYIQTDENGRIKSYCDTPVEGVTIDTEGMTIPEMPTDAVYALYYNETDGLHYVKVAEFDSQTPAADPVMEKLNTIETKLQINEELQAFYDDILKEAGL